MTPLPTAGNPDVIFCTHPHQVLAWVEAAAPFTVAKFQLRSAGPRFDRLIAVRNAQLGHLNQLLRLWQLWLDSRDEPGPRR